MPYRKRRRAERVSCSNSGAMPSAFASAHLGCEWSLTTIATTDRQANTKALKAFGTRRLGETST